MSRPLTSPRLPASRSAIQGAVKSLFERLEIRQMFALPTADLGGPYNIDEGDSVLVSGIGSSDLDGHAIVKYEWDTNYAAGRGFRPRFTGQKFTFKAVDSGTRNIALRVTDANGEISTVATGAINVADVAPTISLTAPNNASEGDAFQISWTHSDLGESDLVNNWIVDWGDGQTKTLPGSANTAGHTYSENGTYTIELTSQQTDGDTTIQHTVVVADNVPVVTAATPASNLNEGDAAELSFSAANRAGTIEGWVIDWGDGNIDQLPASATGATHLYEDNGAFDAKIMALEPDGGQGSATVQFNVVNVNPVVTQTGAPVSGDEGTAITLGSTVSDAGAIDTQTYGWTVYRNGSSFTLPGGTTVNAPSFTFTPTDNGSYVVRLTVVDKDGGSTTVNSDAISVSNVAPLATITGQPGAPMNEGDTVTLTAAPTDAGSEDTFTYAWSVTKGGLAYALEDDAVADAATFDFTPRDNGTYVVSVVVTDDDTGAVTASTTAITVNNVAPVAGISNAPTTANEGDSIAVDASVTDAGADDAHTYAWTVEKLSAGTGGVLNFNGSGVGELSSYNWGADFTVDVRMTLASTMSDGEHFILAEAFHMDGPKLAVVKSGTDYTLVLKDDSGNVVTTGANVFPTDAQFDLAVTYDGTTGATQFYMDGAAVASTGSLPAGLGGMHHTHFSQTTTGGFDRLAIYHGVLAAQDVADLHAGQAISASAYDLWEFGESAGATSTVSTGTNAKTMTLHGGFSFGGAATWSAVTLPAGVATDAADFTFVPADNGTYRIKLVATDDDGATDESVTGNIVVANVAPTGVLTGDAVGDEGEELHYAVAAADVGTADTLSYAWSVTKDNVAYTLPNGHDVSSATFDFTPDDDADYVVTVVVTDDDNASVTYTQNVSVANVAPAPGITSAPTTSDEGTAITVGSSVVDPGANDTVSYAWSVTKGGVAYTLPGNVDVASPGFTFTPEDDGVYKIKLVVTDNANATGETSTNTITVNNVAPVVVVSGEPSADIDEGTDVYFQAAVTDAGVLDTFTYAWSVTRDGLAYALPANSVTDGDTLIFTPRDNGTYVATVVVTDKDGTATTQSSLDVVAVNVAPTAQLAAGAPTTGIEGTGLTLATDPFDAGVDDTHTYAWNVEKLSAGGAGTLTLVGDYIEMGSYDWGTDFTVSGRITIPSTLGNGEYSLMEDAPFGQSRITIGVSGPNVTLGIHNGSSWTQLGNAATLDTPFNFAIAHDDNGMTTFYVNGSPLGGGTVGTGVGGVRHTHMAQGLTGTLDHLGIYHSTLSDADIAALHAGSAIGTAAHDQWDFAEAAGTTTAFSTGANAKSLNVGAATFSGSAVWSAYTLPGGVSTTGDALDFTPTDNGTYRVTLVVTDKDGASDTVVSSDIVVANAAPAPTITGNASVDEASPITLTAAANDVGTADTHTYLWSVIKDGNAFTLPNGTVNNAATFTFTPPITGSYVVSVLVTDNDGGSETATHTIAVNNLAPVVSVTGAPSGARGEGYEISLTATASDPGGDTNLTYAWSLTRDGIAYVLPGDVVTNAAQFAFETLDEGKYVATVVVTDTAGASKSASTGIINVTNANPTAAITGTPSGTVNEGSPITLGVVATDPGASDVLSYAWSVTRNGSAYALPNSVVTNTDSFTFSPNDNGTYVAKVVVSDDDNGLVQVATSAMTVVNVNPIAAITGAPSSSTPEGTQIALGSSVTDGGSADTFTYAWSVTKDGSTFGLPAGAVTNAASFAFVPTDNGSYVVHLTVTDKDAGTSTAQTAALAVTNVNPTATISGAQTAKEGDSVAFSVDATDAGSADTIEYVWSVTRDADSDDLTVEEFDGEDFNFTPDDEGDYTVRVTATDDDGGQVVATRTLSVANVSPVVTQTNVPTSGNEGTAITLGSTVADAGSADAKVYGWTVYKNGQHFTVPVNTDITGPSFTFTPTDNGSYVVRLTVEDGDTGTTTVNSIPVVVGNANPGVTIGGVPSSIDEGDTATLTAAATDVSEVDAAAGFTYLWTVKKGNATVATGTAATFDFSPSVHGVYTVTVKATDKDNGSTTTSATTITVDNVAPTAGTITGMPDTITEAQQATLVGGATDAAGDTLSYSWAVKRNGTAFATATGKNFVFSPHVRGDFEVTMTATDTAGESVSKTTEIEVENVAPAAVATAPTQTLLLGEAATFGLSIDDVPSNQGLSVSYDFGDGQTSSASYTGDQSALSKTHTYAAPGTYTVTITVGDGVDTTTIEKSVTVSRAAVRTDSATGKTDLIVLGTNAADTVKVEAVTGGKYKVTLNGIVLGSEYAPTGKAVINAGEGDDTVTVVGGINALVFAGSGNNGVITGNGNDTVVGGSGVDYVEGGVGRDVIIGQGGIDQLRGGDGEDVLIANTPAGASDPAKLKQFGDLWNSSSLIATRVAAIKATGLFGGAAISDDAAADKLYGDAKSDWFVFNTTTDRVADLQSAIDKLN